ncbi:MAG: rhomboid family intramembrane serine protease [Egibacteraceae bacterium]
MVIPIGDHNPTRRRAWVTWLLVAINVAVFVLLQPWSGTECQQRAFFLRWATIPAELAQGSPLSPSQVAATDPGQCGVQTFTGKEVYLSTLFSLFLHGGWLHLLGNMLYLWVFGNNIEDRFGHLQFLIFYLVSGFVATFVFVVPNLTTLGTLVGASGAIAGVLGAYLVLFPRARVTSLLSFFFFIPVELPALIVLGMWFVLQIFSLPSGPMADGGGVAYLAHIAGFVFGVACTIVYRISASRPPRWNSSSSGR